MSYNPKDLPSIKGFLTKIRSSRERIQTEGRLLSLSLGTTCFDDREREELGEVISILQTAEEKLGNLFKRTKTIIKVLGKYDRGRTI